MIRTATLAILSWAIKLHLAGVEAGVWRRGRRAKALHSRVALQHALVEDEQDRLEFFIDDASIAETEFFAASAAAQQEHQRMSLLKRPPPPPGAVPQIIDKRRRGSYGAAT